MTSRKRDRPEFKPQDLPGELPILPLRNSVFFPGAVMPLTIGRAKTIRLIEEATRENSLLGIVTQRAPEIVIVHDGKPVESVSAGTRGAQIGKYVAIALVPFIIGIAIRGISKDANAYNEGINGAKALLADVKGVKQKMAATK